MKNFRLKYIHFQLFIFFCIFFGGSFVQAKTWYVRPMGYSYSMPLDGTSKEHAFYGLGGVVWGDNGVKGGDTLVLCREASDPQTFTRTLSVEESGSDGNEIIITSENKITPAIINSSSTLNYPGIPGYDATKNTTKGNYAIGADGVSYIKIKDIVVENCCGCRFTDVSHFSIERITCRNVVTAISLVGGSEVLIENCKINYVVNAGIALLGSDPATSIPLENCIIRGNECGNSLDGDGITLHCSNEGSLFSIGTGNKVINNICYNNQEEGLDITSGTDILVEGNETYGNGRCATIAHTAQKVVFKRNYSHDEPGVLIHPSPSEGSLGDVSVLYNVIDSGNYSAIVVSENRNYLIMNNFLRNNGTAIKPATVDIRGDVENVVMKNNIIIAMQPNGYLLRLAEGTPVSYRVSFSHNCWWQPAGPTNNSFYDQERSSYNFSTLLQYDAVENDMFIDPKVKDDFSLNQGSPCIDTGVTHEAILSDKDYVGNSVPFGNGVDIGAVEYMSIENLLSPENLRLR